MTPTLKISAFKDISAFLLSTLQPQLDINLEIKYVKNADEAHQDLFDNNADIVLMSYDDTLSLSLEDKYSAILALFPIHGGILDLCGEIDPEANKNRIGIDTNTGYARALRSYLSQKLTPEEYQNLDFIKAGATNLRYDELINNQIDATLLNPPYSYLEGAQADPGFQLFLGDYQGVVANTNKYVWQDLDKRALLKDFMVSYQAMLQNLEMNSQSTIQSLSDYYSISTDIATNIYNRLWMPNGLNVNFQFNDLQLQGTESIFSQDTNVFVPLKRYWILNQDLNSFYLDPNATDAFNFQPNTDNLGSLVYDISSVSGEIKGEIDDGALSQTNALFHNLVGFYAVKNTSGSILDVDDLNDNGLVDDLLNPGDKGYAQTALRQHVNNFFLEAGANGDPSKNTTASEFGEVVLAGGRFYAPFLIANGGDLLTKSGSFEQAIAAFLALNPGNTGASLEDFQTKAVAYFSFGAANPDASEHLRRLENNTFGFEDLPSIAGVSDYDFNDSVFSFFYRT
ncbi:DUF4114 domain-containing protein [Synechocystis sp. FACHB-383]|uniref:DUF4114 domain-containing protein n=1 Tax=Synechocystis sp. FACHB-383 TaxID=2692864 RepID=UPI00168551CF|nr:DUF4114 domain-containing protein [Synechocystis sp. FACHB-383]MBD2653776.1 DUF4114 domain-containing protein [Synechocystis sp. FACHB-383]